MSSEEEDNYLKKEGESNGDEVEEVGEDDEEEEEGEYQSMEDEKELLFLIEFLVDTMLLKPEHMGIEGMDPCLLQGQTCISLTFLHFPPMSICESDVDPSRQTGGNYIKYNAGKSLMFALSQSQFENPPPICLELTAHKILPHGSVPNKLPIGVTKICLNELFKQVFDKVEEKPDKLPLSKSIKDKYQLVGKKKNHPTAEVTIYIRLSCLGQNVVTEFQRGGDECEPYLFKSKESKKVYECKPKDLEGVDEAENLCPPLPGWGTITAKEYSKADRQGGECFGGYGDYTKSDANIDDEYEEFGTEVQGHALTIKVQKSQKKQLANSDSGSTNGKTKSAESTRGGGNQIAFQVPQSQNICNKSKGANKASVYNVSTPNGENRDSFHIVQGVDSPDKDIFILRIGKKGEAYGKGKLELELRTPKPKIERPIQGPRMWDKAVQTEKEENPKGSRRRGK